jgi:hypothetical protein
VEIPNHDPQIAGNSLSEPHAPVQGSDDSVDAEVYFDGSESTYLLVFCRRVIALRLGNKYALWTM